MDKKQLYEEITNRKIKPKDFEPYDGNNGRVNRCADLIRWNELPAGGVLLDVGGGIGDLGYAVRDLFDRTIVVDISARNLEAARKKGNWIVQADVDKHGLAGLNDPFSPEGEWTEQCLGWPDPSVNLVVALDFIEHIIDPENFARECFRVLKPGGIVFINTPNIRFWRHMEMLVRQGIFPHTSGDKEVFHGGHLAFYTNRDLQMIFGSAGFSDFTLFKDEENYSNPPDQWLKLVVGSMSNVTQRDVKSILEELGSPNLLFRCRKPE